MNTTPASRIDRFLPTTAAVIWILLLRLWLLRGDVGFWSSVSVATRFFGVLCPVLAASLCAVWTRVPHLSVIVAALAVLSFAAPPLAIDQMNAGMEATGSASLGSVAAGLSSLLLCLPMVTAAGLAMVVLWIPQRPVRTLSEWKGPDPRGRTASKG